MRQALAVSTTTATREDAEALAAHLVGSRLAACVQITPIASVYAWKGKVEHAQEHLLTIKTRASLFERLATAIREMHAYETPEILAVPAQGSPDYLDWIWRETDD